MFPFLRRPGMDDTVRPPIFAPTPAPPPVAPPPASPMPMSSAPSYPGINFSGTPLPFYPPQMLQALQGNYNPFQAPMGGIAPPMNSPSIQDLLAQAAAMSHATQAAPRSPWNFIGTGGQHNAADPRPHTFNRPFSDLGGFLGNLAMGRFSALGGGYGHNASGGNYNQGGAVATAAHDRSRQGAGV